MLAMPADVPRGRDPSADPYAGMVALRSVRPHPARRETSGIVMLKFQWNALRRGDRVLVHDPRAADLGVRAGIVTLVDAHNSSHDVGIRLNADTATDRVVWPGRFAVHLDPINDADDCWRCKDNSHGTG